MAAGISTDGPVVEAGEDAGEPVAAGDTMGRAPSASAAAASNRAGAKRRTRQCTALPRELAALGVGGVDFKWGSSYGRQKA